MPIGLLLRPVHAHRPVGHDGRQLPDWHGVHPDHVARLIGRYSRPGDLVLDADDHPAVGAAARYLNRRPGSALHAGAANAGLVLATLPRLTIDARHAASLSQGIAAWGELLRPGGFLVILLIAVPEASDGHRSLVIAAARAAGLLYHQHIPAALDALPEVGPPAHRPPSQSGRHAIAHRDLLAFASTLPEDSDVPGPTA